MKDIELVNKETVRRIIDSPRSKEQMLRMLESIDSVQYKKHTETHACDSVNRQDAIDAMANTLWHYPNECYKNLNEYEFAKGLAELGLKSVPPAQPDAITASLEELINDYGEDGYFIVDGVNYQANELLNELKINSSVGEKFRKKIVKTIVQYFMKFGG